MNNTSEQNRQRMRSIIYRLVDEKRIPNHFLHFPDDCFILLREYLKESLADIKGVECLDFEELPREKLIEA